ncbi:MAG: T9SS type A sorting domain-containing protein [Candidatus Cloacimonetes bacterium]|nr:T9SS type A sorting domain-containing protein [Candidatus Cloacimonadota bacterium]MDD2683732.1 T9SS type A sorting domain-containing protein [Candidatus Cloacimonadota bacterium]
MKKTLILLGLLLLTSLCLAQNSSLVPPAWVDVSYPTPTTAVITWPHVHQDELNCYYLSFEETLYDPSYTSMPTWNYGLPIYASSLDPAGQIVEIVWDGFPIVPGTTYYAYVVVLKGWTFGPVNVSSSFYNPKPDDTLPVTLSSFTAQLTASSFVTLRWVSESESMLSGYRILRNTSENAAEALTITPTLINPTNTSIQHIYRYEDYEVEPDNTYYYWLESVEMNNQTTLHGPVNVVVTSEPVPEFPAVSAMSSVYPNPFRSGLACVDVTLKAGDTAMIYVYNVMGQKVKTFALNPGTHKVEWNGRDDKGTLCSSGVYFYKLSSPSINQTKKMVIIK